MHTPHVPAPGAVLPPPVVQLANDSIIRTIGYYAAVGLVFLKIGLLHEYIAYKTGFDTYLVLICGALALGATIFSGGVQRAWGIRSAHLWAIFGLWIVLAVPFGFWPGGSVDLLRDYFKTSFPLLFVFAGLPLRVQECRRFLYAAGVGGLTAAYFAHAFASRVGIRVGLEFGSIKNSGDLAAHLALTTPFLLFIGMSVRNWFVRIVLIVAALSSIDIVLSTATRAALLTLAAGVLVLMFSGSFRQRVTVLAVTVAGIALAQAVLPQGVINRLSTLWSDDPVDDQSVEALGSAQARKALVMRGIEYAVRNPILGVGPGQFAGYDAGITKAKVGRAQWQVTHNSYIEVAAEAGFPAFICFVGAFVVTLRKLAQVRRLARSDPAATDLAYAALCLMVAVFMHAVSAAFLSLGYAPYAPLLLGLSGGLYLAARNDPAYARLFADPVRPNAFESPPRMSLAARRPVHAAARNAAVR